MKWPVSTLQFRLGLPNNPFGRAYSGSINMDETSAAGTRMRRLGWYQLVLVFKGEGVYHDEQGQNLNLRRGDLIITAPGVLHHCTAHKGTVWSRLTLRFNGPWFDSMHQSGFLKCQVRIGNLLPITSWYQKFYNLLQLKEGESTNPMRYLCRFLVVLSEIPFEAQRTVPHGRPAWLAESLAMIESADQAKPLAARQIAQKCNLGYATFRKQFPHYVGCGPSEYHKNLRIKTASELIAYGNESFKQIALQLGFYDENYFARFFREKTGLTPSQFKAELISRNIKEIDSERVQKLALQEWFKSESEKRLLEEKTAAERRRNWRLVFTDDFSDADVLSRWDIHEAWEIKNGELWIHRKESALCARLKTPIVGDVRLVFDCHLESENLSDIGCFLASTALPMNSPHLWTGGYLFQYGGWSNQRNALLKGNDALMSQRASPLVRGRRYHVEAQKIGNRLILNVDNQTIFDVRDSQPIFGEAHAYIGLYSWGTDAYYSNVQVYTRDFAVQADLLETAEDYRMRGSYIAARELFQDVIHSSQDPLRREQARHGLDQTTRLIRLATEFSELQARLLRIWPAATIKSDSRGLIVNIEHLGIQDLSPLQGIPLHELHCANNQIATLQPLCGNQELTWLSCPNNRIRSLEPLHGMRLQFLDCSDNRIDCLRPLTGMKLTRLLCAKNRISSLEPLRGMPLTGLMCSHNRITDLGPLQGMELQGLSFENNLVTSLSPLRGMPFSRLTCSWNQITDLAPLRGNGLLSLRCNGNRITSLESLRKMPLRYLNCSWNKIQDLAPVSGMELSTLSCHDNPIRTLQPILKHPLHRLYVDLDHLSTFERQSIQARTKKPGFDHLCHNAAILFHLKRKQYDQVKALAQTFGNHRYLIIPRESSWLEANEICAALGGHLAVIRNQKENDYLRSFVSSEAELWIGLSLANGKPVWVTGEPCRFQNIDLTPPWSGSCYCLNADGMWKPTFPWVKLYCFCVEWGGIAHPASCTQV